MERGLRVATSGFQRDGIQAERERQMVGGGTEMLDPSREETQVIHATQCVQSTGREEQARGGRRTRGPQSTVHGKKPLESLKPEPDTI